MRSAERGFSKRGSKFGLAVSGTTSQGIVFFLCSSFHPNGNVCRNDIGATVSGQQSTRLTLLRRTGLDCVC